MPSFVFDTPWQDFGPSTFHMGGVFSPERYETDVFDTVCNYDTLECFNVDGSKWEVDWIKPFDSKLREKYFTHYKKEWLDGFELENIFNYHRGDVIVFDRSQAHSGIDFMKYQITMKGMLSLMTTISHV